MKMNQFKKLALFCASTIVALSCFEAEAKQTFRIASNQVEAHPNLACMPVFIDYVESKLPGKYDIQIYGNESLGSNERVLELVRQGVVQGLIVSCSNVEAFDPVYALFSLPYLFSSEEQFEKYFSDPETLNQLNQNREKDKFEALTVFNGGTRNFYTRKPVRQVSDMAGKKIRVQASATNVAMIEALGAAATPMSYGEVYTALQQGVVDGAENTEMSLVDMKHGEVCKYYTYDKHQISPDIFLVSTRFMDDIPSTDRQVFMEAAREAQKTQFSMWKKRIEEVRKVAKDNLKVEFIDVDVNEFKQKVLPLHEKLLNEKPVMKPFYEAIQNVK